MTVSEEIFKLASEYVDEGKKFVLENKLREAEKSVLRAKELCEEESDEYILANIMNILGVIYNAMEEDSVCATYYMEALTHAKRGLEQEKDKNSEKYKNLVGLISILYNNIGSRFMANNDYDSALVYFKKADETIDYNEAKVDKGMRIRAFVILLNFATCNLNLGDYEEAFELVKQASQYTEDPTNIFSTFSCAVVYAEIMWKLGEEEWVWSHLEDLIEGATENSDGKDYMEDMASMCRLLSWMKAFYQWKRIIDIMDGFRKGFNSTAYDILVEETYMKYYEMLGEQDRYTEKCVTLTKLYQKQQQEKKRSQAQSITIRLAYVDNEEKRIKADALSVTDKLTGIGNRRKLERDINEILPDLIATDKKIGFGIVDIDFFKRLNDTYGHLQGDVCLKTVAEILRDSMREVADENGSVYRFGGDEFVIVVKAADEAIIERFANHVREKLNESAIPNDKSEVSQILTLSQGYVCVLPKEGTAIEDYMVQADQTLYEVKANGRNNYLIK